MSKDEPEMKVLKTATTKSITGKSSLTYQIGVTPDSTLHIRIIENTGAGFFNNEWIKIEDIQKALAEGRKGDPLTSFLLQSLVKGKSVNTPAFVMAALTNERLLRVLHGKKRGHESLDPEGFDAKMDRLVSSKSGGTAKTSTKKTVRKTTKKTSKKTGGNAAIKKKSTARKK